MFPDTPSGPAHVHIDDIPMPMPMPDGAAATYATMGIRFNVVAPGLVDSPLSQPITNAPAARKISETLHPMGRLGTPEDVAPAVCWLLDPEQAWVTGQVIGVDGGLGRVQPRPRIGSNAS